MGGKWCEVLVSELLSRIDERGVTLRCEHNDDRLHYSPRVEHVNALSATKCSER
jgi:hypothetical protein